MTNMPYVRPGGGEGPQAGYGCVLALITLLSLANAALLSSLLLSRYEGRPGQVGPMGLSTGNRGVKV